MVPGPGLGSATLVRAMSGILAAPAAATRSICGGAAGADFSVIVSLFTTMTAWGFGVTAIFAESREMGNSCTSIVSTSLLFRAEACDSNCGDFLSFAAGDGVVPSISFCAFWVLAAVSIGG